ncbi:outer membrane protein assembly factor BamA [Sphingobium sufflavum]|uniref:outer membrane protein assembly factor BamA n=1 Tax=Sphingobium sufflavum TaxID=1129547 RepID=UPI002DD433B5|nr:outer membrane protein assembly factor BamA [Sphingobium sufflavum]
MAGTALGGMALTGVAMAQTPASPAKPSTKPAPKPAARRPAASPAATPATPLPSLATGTIKSVVVTGNQRIERDTVLSYTKLRTGESYTQETLDAALKDLFATELFADVKIRDDKGALSIEIVENPVINRIVLEGNKRIKEEKILPEIKMAPRQIYTRSKVRADVARIIELYRRQGRFAAVVDPKLVKLDQNRVDIVYEISEGPKSKVRQINIIGNDEFSDGRLRSEMATKQARSFRIFSSGTTYDPDRLAYDQQKLRQFYLTQGYADFRVVSAVAELTPDKQDFIITYVVEEGSRYKFGDVAVQSEIRDLNSDALNRTLPMKKGDWYNAKLVEDTVDRINETAGLFGYAFADVSPDFNRDKDSLSMGITFRIGTAPRVYVERVDINGNTLTKDKVIRREFRLAEGDAFNSFLVKRSQDRINSLGFFQEKLTVEQKPGSAPDRIVLETNVEEKSTGELQLSAGFSSLEKFIVSASIKQRNFRGMGQELRTSVNYSSYSKSVEVGFTEPYFLDRNIALGGDIFRRDLNSFNYLSDNTRNTTYQEVTTGFQLRAGVPVTEYLSLGLRYGLSLANVTLDQATYYSVINGVNQCDELKAGRYLCDAIGKRTTSSIGYSLIYDRRDNRIRPQRGFFANLSQDVAGLGGDVRYVRTRLEGGQYYPLGGGFIFSLRGEAGHIFSFEKTRYDSSGSEIEKVRLTDRFYLGEPQMRGFDIRGVGPRIRRQYFDSDGNLTAADSNSDDALGGKLYYLTHAEIEIPLGAGARELGLRPSIFMDAGAVGSLRRPRLYGGSGVYNGTCTVTTTTTVGGTTSSTSEQAAALTPGKCKPVSDTTTMTAVYNGNGFQETYLGDSLKPRLSVGFGVNWNSPFGPFRIDIAKVLLKEPGDDTKTITFNIGTQF